MTTQHNQQLSLMPDWGPPPVNDHLLWAASKRAKELAGGDGSPRLVAAIRRYTRVKEGEVDAKKLRRAEAWER